MRLNSGTYDAPTDQSNVRLERWLDARFGSLPKELKNRLKAKWRAINHWHKMERHVWFALRDLTSMRTPEGKARALIRLEAAYKARNEAKHAAERAHFKAGHLALNGKLRHLNLSTEIWDLLQKHPGFYPPRL